MHLQVQPSVQLVQPGVLQRLLCGGAPDGVGLEQVVEERKKAGVRLRDPPRQAGALGLQELQAALQ